MKRIIKALAAIIRRPKAGAGADEPDGPISVENVSMPDIYADRHDAIAPDSRVIDQPTLDVDMSAGFNPYDTAILRKKMDPKPR